MSKAETIALIKAFGGSGGSNSGGTQPDWNQNDETAPDYVKNRTHYVEISEVVQEKMLFDGRVQTCDYRELIAYTLNDDIVFDSETKYCVKIGDKVYKEISFKPLDDIYRHQFSYVNEDGESEEEWPEDGRVEDETETPAGSEDEGEAGGVLLRAGGQEQGYGPE